MNRDASSQTRRARSSWSAVLVALLVLVSGVLGPGTAPAVADDTSAAVAITGIDPMAVASSADLTLTGTVTNTGSSQITDATLRLWSVRGPITNGDALYNALSSNQNPSSTPTVHGDGASSRITELAAGASAPYSLKASFTSPEALGMTSTSSAYLVGAMLLDSGGNLIASASTVIAYPGGSSYQAAAVAELSSAPSLVPTTDDSGVAGQAVFTDDHLADEIVDGGRLDLIADLAETDGVTGLIDPLLWDELTAMSAGYRVRTGPETTTAGTGQDSAASFLERLRRIAANGRSYRTLYGSPDITAVAASGRDWLIGAATDALADGHPLAGLPLAVATNDSSTSQTVVDILDQIDPQLVLAADLDADGELYRADGLTMLATHASIASGAPGEGSNSDAQRATRLQAEQLVYALSGSPAVDVVTTADAARAELAEATGRTRVTVEDLIVSQQAVAIRVQATTPSTTTNRTDAERTAHGSIGVYEELTGSSTGLDADALALSIWSSSFTSDDAAAGYVQTALSPISSALSSGEVSVHISERLVIPDDDSALPVSVTNTMNVPVRVRIHFASDNPRRISIADTDVLEIDAGDSVTVRIAPRATSNGDVQMSAVVMTTGERATEIGPRTEFIVSANSSGRVAWVIIIASGAVLMTATALRIRQVRRERGRPPTAGDDGGDGPAGGPDDATDDGAAD
ncbi:DUF6049 family protein [uncultured Propionibacterium sp.]|uniref:DUF6049 family protein n=1 Tax=uncultured Propionibacterium sp. TaxID=218066 RepID=UPI00292DA46A|nr:DUF6049 family protein [uncultured Propionibacterium sp.]